MFPRFTAPKTLTKAEQSGLLRAVRAHGSRRDRAILSLALGTGLRRPRRAGGLWQSQSPRRRIRHLLVVWLRLREKVRVHFRKY